jgi:23S rRNA pseudouridine1911/1915/1917 synthase
MGDGDPLSTDVDDADSGGGARLIVLAVAPEAAGRRLDQWLAEALGPEVSRSRVQALVRQGAVTVSGATTSPSLKLSTGQSVEITLPEPEPADPRGEDIPLAVLFEDADLIVVDKPAGLVVHPGAGNWTGTLVNALIHHCGDSLSGIGGVRRPGIVHRLDKDTSGVIVAAKSDRAHRALADLFADHGRTGGLERAYWALAWGAPERGQGMIDAPLGRAADRVRRAVVPAARSDARHAVTRYAVQERFGSPPLASLVECRLETGRTHQIRVHMAHIGHPLIGDADYGGGFRSRANRLPEPARSLALAFPRQALHARLLAFPHPATGQPMRFETDPPADFQVLAAALRNS